MAPDDRLKRKLTTIFYADVVGYSRLIGEDEEGTYRLVRDRLDLMSESIRSHGGAVINFAGEAILADFPTASEALACAAGPTCGAQDRPTGRRAACSIKRSTWIRNSPLLMRKNP